jgi:hypothetical protein
MALFEFTPKFKPPKGYSEVKFDFTEEESKAINRNLKMYGSIANEDAPEGMVACIPEKARNGIIAQALCQYVEDLLRGSQRCSADVMEKAIKAQMKAYAVHNLPVYLFQVAGMFERAGDATNANEFFRQFLEAQTTFHPDSIDTSFLNQTDFDIPKSVALAKQKVR